MSINRGEKLVEQTRGQVMCGAKRGARHIVGIGGISHGLLSKGLVLSGHTGHLPEIRGPGWELDMLVGVGGLFSQQVGGLKDCPQQFSATEV